jgi:hypothetical protein
VEERAASSESITQALKRQKVLRSRKLGEYLTANEIVSHEQLAAALKAQKTQPAMKLGETLVELGFLQQGGARRGARHRSARSLGALGRVLADMGVLDIEVVHNVMARKLGIPVVNLDKVRPSAGALKRIPAAMRKPLPGAAARRERATRWSWRSTTRPTWSAWRRCASWPAPS